ncbi:hypothetical protein KIPB_009102, partial [Kipferlia bialata]
GVKMSQVDMRFKKTASEVMMDFFDHRYGGCIYE